jgi:hypothetical protein
MKQASGTASYAARRAPWTPSKPGPAPLPPQADGSQNCLRPHCRRRRALLAIAGAKLPGRNGPYCLTMLLQRIAKSRAR